MPKRTCEKEQDGKVVHTRDGSVDWYGNPSVRSKSGGWIAAQLLLGMQFLAMPSVLMLSILFSVLPS